MRIKRVGSAVANFRQFFLQGERAAGITRGWGCLTLLQFFGMCPAPLCITPQCGSKKCCLTRKNRESCAQLLTGLCFCWVIGRMGVEEVVAESFLGKWMCFILSFRSDAARSCSAIFWLPSSGAGCALCCHPLGKQVWRVLYPCLFLGNQNEVKIFFYRKALGVLRK